MMMMSSTNQNRKSYENIRLQTYIEKERKSVKDIEQNHSGELEITCLDHLVKYSTGYFDKYICLAKNHSVQPRASGRLYSMQSWQSI